MKVRARLAAALLAAATVVAAVVAPATVGAEAQVPEPPTPVGEPVQLAEETSGPGSLAELITDPSRIHPEVLAGIVADPALVGERGQQLIDLRAGVEAEELRLNWAIAEQDTRTRTVAEATIDQAAAQVDVAAAVEDQTLKEANLLALSIDAFVTNSDEPDLGGLFTSTTAANAATVATELIRTDRLIADAGSELVLQRDDSVVHRQQRDRELNEATSRLTRESGLLTEAIATETDANEILDDLTPRLGPTERRFEQDLLLRTMPGTDNLQIVAINAYFNASQIAHGRWPGCRISWHQLAGVGRVESFHGNFGPSKVNSNGQVSPRILGPQLNGDPWLAIPDTDGGTLDGDLEWDRAVGPMQFIPTSWDIFSGDGNGDGRKDPHNLYDATVAAADHLCGSGLDSPERFREALLGYNRSVKYGSDVMDFSERYEVLADITDPWLAVDTDQG